MDRNRFNAEVRPYVTTIPIGLRGIAFDRRELDAWADKYIGRFGQAAQEDISTRFDKKQPTGGPTPPRDKRRHSTDDEEWGAAVARVTGRRSPKK